MNPTTSGPMQSGNTGAERSMLLRVSEVADELRLARSFVYHLIQIGELPAVRIGRSVRVPRAALEEWVAKRTEASWHE